MSERGRIWLAAALVLVASAALYLRTLHPSVPGGDAGELIAVAAHLEVAHPPGYPLFTLLAKLATLVPYGSVAARVNALSALADAAAAGLLTATVVGASGSALAGVFAGMLFACSPVVWAYAVGAEVFPLNNLLVAALLYLALRCARAPEPRGLTFTVAAVVGLGLANHHTFVFYAVPVVLWMLWSGDPASRAPARLAALALTVSAGLATYLYLPLAARHATTLSWGDPTTLAGFAHHVLRRDYGTFHLVPTGGVGSEGVLTRLTAYATHLGRATLWVGALLAAIGAAAALRSWTPPLRAWAACVLAAFAGYVLTFHTLANLPVADPLLHAVTARFWQQADVVVFLFCGIGLAVVVERGPRARRVLVALSALVLVAVQLVGGWSTHDRHRDDTVARYGRALLEPLLPNTLLLTRGDLPTNATRYLQACEGVRPDVVVLDQELMTKPWYVARAAREHPSLRFPAALYDPTAPSGFTMRAFLDANAPDRPIFVYPDWKSGDPSVAGAYELWPMGLPSRVAPLADAPSVDDWQRASVSALAALDAYQWPALATEPLGTWERVALDDVWQAHHRFGWWLLTKATQPGVPDVSRVDAARMALERAERTHPSPPFFLYRNLGIAYEHLALRDSGWREPQRRAWRRYLDSAPADDGARGAIAATVARLDAEARP